MKQEKTKVMQTKTGYFVRFRHEYYQGHEGSIKQKICWEGPFPTKAEAEAEKEAFDASMYYTENNESGRPDTKVIRATLLVDDRWKREEYKVIKHN